MTAEVLLGTMGVLLSLLFAYFPGFKGWYGALPQEKKQLTNLLLLFLITVVVAVLSFFKMAGGFGLTVTFDLAGLTELVKIFVIGMIANAGTYASTKYVGVKAKG